ncbi:fimbrial protein [Providencia sp. Je.9.19]|uniref:fimbrial protein n=1 Tax=unclassified Providencia TaxID=2633465 RepID=UPI003DA7E8CE
MTLYKIVIIFLRCFISLSLLFSMSAKTANYYSININVKFVQSTCDISGDSTNLNSPINIDFKDIVENKINGVNYEQTIPYFITCGGSGNPSLKLMMSGPKSDFNDDLLMTTENTLALNFKLNNVNLKINTWNNIAFNNQPKLTVVPIISNRLNAIGGVFNASAALVVDYQ